MELDDQIDLGSSIERTVAVILNSLQQSRFAFLREEDGYSSEVIIQADRGFAATMEMLFSRWIESGRSGEGGVVDTPRDRNVETVSEGFSKPLSTELFSWLARNPPMPIVESTGEAAYHYPIPDYLKLKTDPRLVGHDLAIWWFIRLTDSPHRYRLARCFNQECAKYFVYSRNPRSSIKNGVFCVACAAVASMCRTRKSRDAKESAMLEAAADAWQRWKPTRTHPDQRAWVAKQINGTCGSDIKPKWVSQHLGKILEKVEAKRHAKG